MTRSSDFYNLHPGLVLNMTEQLGFEPTGQYIQLNSYENRVFDIQFEATDLNFQVPGFNPKIYQQGFFNLVIKVYRPNRWSWKAIQEEHDFLYKLRENDMPAVAPIKLNGQTLFEYQGLFFCLFPKAIGRMVQELMLEDYLEVGKQIAKLHNTGAHFKSNYRPCLDVESFGDQSLEHIERFIYPELQSRYFEVADEILGFLEENLNPASYICLHGDCHKGNILQTDPRDGRKEYFFVDLDDFCIGPEVQDFWMLLDNTDIKDNRGLQALIKGYQSLRHFDQKTLRLIPGLQALRIISYAAWIAKRWSDPSFKKIFPSYLEYNYWLEEIRSLEDCLSKLKSNF